MLYMLFAPLINIIFDMSTSNNIGIRNIYAKNSRKRCLTSSKYLPPVRARYYPAAVLTAATSTNKFAVDVLAYSERSE